MALPNPLAFGPLPQGQIRANQRMTLDLPGSPTSGFKAPAEDTGEEGGLPALQRVGEEFQPLFPELGQDTGEATGGGTDFTSQQSMDLSGLTRLRQILGLEGTGTDAGQGGAVEGGASLGSGETDFSRAFKALTQANKLSKGSQTLLTSLLGGGPQALGREVAAGGAPPSDIFSPDVMGGAVPGQASGASGALGTAGAAGLTLSAILNIAAQATGDPDLKKAAQAAGVGTGALGIGSTIASLAPLIGMAPGAAVPTGVAAGLGSGAAAGLPAAGTAGLGTAVGAAALPIAILSLVDAIGPLVGKDEGTLGLGRAVSEMLAPTMGSYWTFPKQIAQSMGTVGSSLNTLSQALPYVQSKEDLGQLLNTYKQAIAGPNDWTVGQQFGSADPYQIGFLPAAGGSSHEGGLTMDPNPEVQRLQLLVDALDAALPGANIGAGPGATQGPATDLWNQIATNTAREKARSEGLNMDLQKYLTPTDWAALEEAFPAPVPIAGGQSAAYQAMTLIDLLNAMTAQQGGR